jgi:hypothetical protein
VPEALLPLGFTQQWINLGIVSAADMEQDAVAARESGDSRAEHYRWRAFTKFLSAQTELPASLAVQLYELGVADLDPAMGGSMMATLLQRPDCPEKLLRQALDSERTHLRTIATARLDRSNA